MEEIIQSIKQAEEKATSVKEAALLKSHEIIAQAESDAREFLRTAEVKRKNDRENALRIARDKADAEYRSSVESSRKEAKTFADGCIEKLDRSVQEIVRRIVSGDC